MEKKKIEENIGDAIEVNNFDSVTGSISIDQLTELLDKSKQHGATDIEITINSFDSNEVNYVILQPILIRDESNQEYNLRISKEKDHIDNYIRQQEIKERELYLDLKKKFEK